MTDVTPLEGPRAPKLPNISFEFFPPKTEEMERNLWDTIKRLAPLTPNFVSVTYGAGGSTRERTHATIVRILKETCLLPAAHLTCVGASRGEIDEVVDRYHEAGVRHIVALRGDPASGIGTPFVAHPDGYKTSPELVAGIRKRHADIEVSVSAYPEKHPEARDFDRDIDTLQAKVDAGATRAITQVFFDNDFYLRYLDRVRARGIKIPIVPGIMPMHNFKQARNFVTRAGTTVPDWLAQKFDGLDHDAETRKLVAATVAAGQVQKLAKHGIDTFHFYTMNRADLVFAICHLLGIRPKAAQEAA
ncbi:methylenetetrahydrofolate reductase [NAD(P)H] [Bradyrhizobium sp.]|uniref:methylenetetrahydrofolate reductase [NAD(P)H] n=2 Tax=Bradyrhizobium sp. TaxID=376 RepID=UPI001DBD2768|nr:methylenetetrahydrofolate reductase [NAD(P)H] [Bradyrhizobium sp.]MBV8698044.1 methylenetetrahydrofolate reductase [NAD(P)H] [Bradyrhizobium sp.]MBV8918085.1 methylenetetrahydrofolate reductase [NAD(P)H] [Bradyrhizobium sp.]